MQRGATLKSKAQTSRNVATAVTLAATALFALLASHSLTGFGGTELAAPRQTLLVPLLLTIALIILAWRRSTESSALVAALEESQRRERKLAYFDELTGLHNRRYLKAESPLRGGTRGYALLLLDLDGFKGVNDLHGHEVGDAVLRTIADRIVQCVPEGGEVVRLGGDEFAICLGEFCDDATASRLADAIIAEAGLPIAAGEAVVRVGVSVGLTSGGVERCSLSDALRRADIAMYEAKRRGKNCAVWFTSEMEQVRNAKSKLESEIRGGVNRGEFIPHFQPLLDLSHFKIRGFEALARWQHPTRGLLEPSEFMDVATHSGLIADLSNAVMAAAIDQATRWPDNLVLSINLSRTELRDPALAGRVIALMEDAGLPGERLEVEVCESSLLHESEVPLATISRLRSLGIGVSLEDFGTGYAALARLRELPFDRIKIDRSFVQSLSSDCHSGAIVAAITALGKSLSLPITAEGIEEVRAQKLLLDLGATEGQGWLYGDAISGEQTAQLLSALDGFASVREDAKPGLRPDTRAA